MFPDILPPFIIFLIPQTSRRAASAAVRPATEEGGPSPEPDHTGAAEYPSGCLHSCFLFQPTCVYFFIFFGKCQERVNSVQALYIWPDIDI